jgi:hypothetical protein
MSGGAAPVWVRRLLQHLSDRVGRVTGAAPVEHSTVRGFPVALQNTRPDIATPFVIERFSAALDLIELYQPWRMRHLRRDVVQFWVAAYPSRGVYFPADRTILTELSFLARAPEFSPAQVASSILHEGVHARVHQMGVHLGFGGARDAAREERLCRRAEIAFGQSLPLDLGAPVIARAADALALDDAAVAPVVDWAEAHAAKERADREAVRRWRAQ